MKEKDAAAVTLGRKGGQARAKKLNKTQRQKIARNAAKARWAEHKTKSKREETYGKETG